MYFHVSLKFNMGISLLTENMALNQVTLNISQTFLSQAKDVFEKLCPDEEFLQAVPNPEDIILDDFLQDGNHNAVEPEGGAQDAAAEPGSGEEDGAGAGQEHAEGDSLGRQPSDGDESHSSAGRQEQDGAGAINRPSDEEGMGLGTGQDQANSNGANGQATEGDKRVSEADSASRQSSEEESKLAAAGTE